MLKSSVTSQNNLPYYLQLCVDTKKETKKKINNAQWCSSLQNNQKKTNEEKQMKTRDDTGHRLPHPHDHEEQQ